MKKLINYFTPRDRDEIDSLIGLFCGLFVLGVVFYFYSI